MIKRYFYAGCIKGQADPIWGVVCKLFMTLDPDRHLKDVQGPILHLFFHLGTNASPQRSETHSSAVHD